MKVVLATSNPGKVREARAVLAASEIEIVSVPLWLGDVETGTTYLSNARLKASSAMRMLHTAVLAEDAGLEIDSLGGLPGIRSARFAGPDATSKQNNAKVLELLRDVRDGARTARFRAVAVLLLPDGTELVGEGTYAGTITREERGSGGFGYDPLFVPDGHIRSAAELGDDEKNRISHRGLALRALAAQL